MILPVHESVRTHVARLLTTIYALDENAQPTVALEYPPNRELGDLGTCCVRARAASAQGAAGDRSGDRRRLRNARGVHAVSAAPNGYLNFSSNAGRSSSIACVSGRSSGIQPPARPSSSTPRSIRTRRPTSATCATRSLATRSSGSFDSGGSRSKCRTTSTTPACRSRTWLSGFV